jgi:hypothetical protein
MRGNESRLQEGCVKWFRYHYPHHRKLLFSIPNGGHRNPGTAITMKAEGTVPGIPDLMLAIPRHGHHGLFLETKYGKGKLTEDQEEIKRLLEKQNYKHVTYYTLDEFIREVTFYMNL